MPWNCYDADVNKENLLEATENIDMIYLNKHIMTELGESKQSSRIDLVFCTTGILDIAKYQI